MNKEILYKGVNTTPSANMSIDGDSSMLYNLIPEDNAIKPIMPPKELAHFDNLRQVFIHKNNFTHYIVIQQQENNAVSLSCYDSQWKPIQLNFMQVKGYKQISAMGNMLIISKADEMRYALWNDDKYMEVNRNKFNIKCQFALFGNVKSSLVGNNDVNNDAVSIDEAMGKAVKMIKDTTDASQFIYPFFVRYAVKLFDGSYSYVSAPILMIPNSGSVPFLYREKIIRKGVRATSISLYAFCTDLMIKIPDKQSYDLEEIVAGIDIFVSRPIYTFDQNRKVQKDEEHPFGGRDNSLITLEKRFKNSQGIYSFDDIFGFLRYDRSKFGMVNDHGNEPYKKCSIIDNLSNEEDSVLLFAQLAPLTPKTIHKNIINTSSFYLVASIPYKEIKENQYKDDFKIVQIEKGMLNALETKTQLQVDDILNDRTITTATTHVYNNRLHAFNASFKLSEAVGIANCNNYVSESDSEDVKDMQYEALVFIKTANGKKLVRNFVYGVQNDKPWIFYPDNNAYKIVILSHKQRNAMVYPLTTHPLLNGAYWLADDITTASYQQEARTDLYDFYNELQQDNNISNPSTIYVSDTNNPFYFRSVNTVSVGCNKIYALSSAAKALSQGQFGQFPLYAFTDNGVWALQTNNTGSYSARQPVTRDVCVNAESITQLDSAVLFSTDRGIMLLEGATATCISNAIFGVNTVPITALPQFKQLYAHANLSSSATVPQITDIHDMQYLYDYIHQRIIAYVQSSPVAFVFSIKSKQWGMMQSNFKHSINAYPDTMAITNGNHVITLSDVSYERQLDYIGTQLLVTRPLNIDAQNIFKTVNTVIQRGLFKKGNVMQVLFASNDLLNWVIVWSSTDQYLRGFSGTPYKYYRMALLTTLHANECVTGATVQFLPKLTNQPR